MQVLEDQLLVSWQDGHGLGLKALTKEYQLEKESALNIVTVKHASAPTGTT